VNLVFVSLLAHRNYHLPWMHEFTWHKEEIGGHWAQVACHNGSTFFWSGISRNINLTNSGQNKV
jgi:hypothetical protein